MSHVAQVSIDIRDLDALEQACKTLGLELRRGQKTHRYYGGAQGPCEHAIGVVDGSSHYEIGLVSRGEGKPGWQLAWDSWSAGLREKVGNDLGKLKQQYAVAVATRTAQRQGLRVQQTIGANGSIVLRCVK
jgi:hypothetical protein